MDNKIKICSPTHCTLCYACYNVCPQNAISLVENCEGFAYPQINYDKCVGCGLCLKSCPETNQESIKRAEIVKSALACWAKDEEIRKTSSSGGIFSVMAKWVIEQGGTVFGAAYDDDLAVRHIAVNTMRNLCKLQGSKYTQSIIGDVYRQVKSLLKEDKYVLFTGVPCQIAGLNGYLGKEYDKLYTVDVICHGTPSQKVFSYYRELLKQRLSISQIDTFSFRDTKNWSCSCSCSCSSVEYPVTHENNLYMRLFLSSLIHKEACYQCKYANLQRVSDITIGDFWGIGKYGAPFTKDTKYGVSLALVNSAKGKELFSGIRKQIFVEERDIDEALKLNIQLYKPSVRPRKRDISYDYILSHSYDEIERKFYGPAVYRKVRKMVGNIIRYIKRIFPLHAN